jgi:hypothetical protein
MAFKMKYGKGRSSFPYKNSPLATGPKTERKANMDRERELNELGSTLPAKDPMRQKMFDEADALQDERYRRAKEGNPMQKNNMHMKKSPYKTDNATTTDKMQKRQSASISHQSDFRKQQAAKELARVQAYKDAQKKKQ